ncbi:MAG: CHAT domain-containing protein [Pseudomonadota bacterium]|nr:CHAT domain-containing protein [Pseudomonadota bacterium]
MAVSLHSACKTALGREVAGEGIVGLSRAFILAGARRNAAEAVQAYVSSMTEVKDFELQKDLIAAYANATVTVIEEMERGWYKDSAMGDCFKIRIKTEVTPDEKAMKMARKTSSSMPPSRSWGT